MKRAKRLVLLLAQMTAILLGGQSVNAAGNGKVKVKQETEADRSWQ